MDKTKTQGKSQSAIKSNKTDNNIPRPILSDSSPLLEFESKNIAKYLTLIDFAVLKSMTFFDITIWWRKRKALESPNSTLGGENLIESHLDAFIRRSNMVITINYQKFYHTMFNAKFEIFPITDKSLDRA
jgi:hypothetical protein